MRTICLIIVVLACLVTARGLFRMGSLAGHDTNAYYVSQSEFHENIREGVVWPRWHPDGRYGYGDVKLQHRPPLPHFLAEPYIFMTGKRILAAHLAVATLVCMAGLGMLLLLLKPVGIQCAAVGAVAYLTTNYLLSNLYLRGAWYEAAAYAAMPWVLWANEELLKPGSQPVIRLAGVKLRRIPFFFALGALAWAALVCGHPQTAAFFVPLALSHVCLRAWAERSSHVMALCVGAFACGLLISAPSWLATALELPYVRMQLFDLGLETYFRHFLDLPALLFESWPVEYTQYKEGLDYVGRPIPREMRALNLWALATLAAAPVLWLLRPRNRLDKTRTASLFFYFWFAVEIAVALPLSWGLWEYIRPLQYFNFPWRSLGVANLCLAILTALTLRQVFLILHIHPPAKAALCVGLAAWMIACAYPHSAGWQSQFRMTEESLTPSALRQTDGIPQHFHTPMWVADYPTRTPDSDIEILDGKGKAINFRRSATVWDFELTAETPVMFQINHHYYPGWRLYVDKQNPIDAVPSSKGLMVFTLPEGRHTLSLRLESTYQRTMADGLGLIGLLALAVAALYALNPFRLLPT